MTFFSKPWGFGSVVLGLIGIMRLVAASTTVRAQAPTAPTVAPAHAPVTFTKDVAPILQRSCVVCHRPEQIAPMSLKTYRRRAAVCAIDQEPRRGAHHAAVAHRTERRDHELQG